MKKRFFAIVALVLSCACLCSCARFKKPEPLPETATALSGVFLQGASEAPYKEGEILFTTLEKGTYKYKELVDDEDVNAGADTTDWTSIKDGQTFVSSSCRNIAIAEVALDGTILAAKIYDYIPGILYGLSNPDQYDDKTFYQADNKTLEDDRAVRLASNLFKTADTSYYGKEYGYIIQGYLTKYSDQAGYYDGYFHTGCDITTEQERPFYSPIDGEVLYAGQSDAYNMIIIYSEQHDVSLLILHAGDVSPAQKIADGAGTVKKGELLGYGGSAGDPAGSTHLHLELVPGVASRYQNFSKTPEYTRRGTLDPLIIADMFDLKTVAENSFSAFEAYGTDSFSAQNNASVVLVGNWMYFFDPMQKSIIKARPNGTEQILLATLNAKNLNYSRGELYFSNLDDNGYIYKLNCLVAEPQPELVAQKDSSAYLFLVNDTLYFSDLQNKGAICSVNKQGNDFKVIVNRYVTDPFYTPNGFYYTQDADKKAERVHYYSFEEKKNMQLISVRAERPFVYDNYLAYSKKYDGLKGYAKYISVLDGTEAGAMVITPDAFNQIYVYNKWFVYSNLSDGESLYIKLKQNDVSSALTKDILCKQLSMRGNWLYYVTFIGEGEVLTRINLTSHVMQRFVSGAWISETLELNQVTLDILSAKTEKDEIYSPEAELPPTPTPDPNATPTPEPTVAPEGEEPTPTPEVTEPTPTPEGEEPTPTPEAEEPTPTPEGEEPTPTPEGEEPTPTPEVTEPTPTPEAEEPTPTPEAETPTATPEVQEETT